MTNNEFAGKVDVYHNNLPSSSVGFAAFVIALTYLFSTCGTNAAHEYQHVVHSDTAKRVCEAATGRDDPRCVGYFAH